MHVSIQQSDGNTDFFNINAVFEYIWISIDLIIENCFALKKVRNRPYPAETMIYTDYADLAILANTLAQVGSLLHSLKQAAGGISLYVNRNKTKFMCFKPKRAITTQSGNPLKLVD